MREWRENEAGSRRRRSCRRQEVYEDGGRRAVAQNYIWLRRAYDREVENAIRKLVYELSGLDVKALDFGARELAVAIDAEAHHLQHEADSVVQAQRVPYFWDLAKPTKGVQVQREERLQA